MNVWIALAAQRHEHHTAARDWFVSLPEEGAAFCRVTQMGLLRLLSSPRVMGAEALSADEAWRNYRELRRDWRVVFASEPAGIEQTWIRLMTATKGTRSWTDAYLAAFALGHGYTLASFDGGFARWKELRFRLLMPGRSE